MMTPPTGKSNRAITHPKALRGLRFSLTTTPITHRIITAYAIQNSKRKSLQVSESISGIIEGKMRRLTAKLRDIMKIINLSEGFFERLLLNS